MRRPHLLRLAALAVLMALLAPLTVRWLTHRMLYYPEPGETRTPAAVGLDYRSVSPVAADGVRLSGWWLENPDTEYVLVWFHGNAGNLSGRVERVARFFAEGLSVLALDYRGYGLSEGAPTPEGTHADARAAWEFLVGEAGVEPGRIVLLGSSLGAAVALGLAREQPDVACVVLEAPFLSVRQLGREVLPIVPSFLVPDVYDNLAAVEGVRAPLTIYHGTADSVIGVHHGERLYAAARAPKALLRVRGGDHQCLDAREPLDVLAYACAVARGEESAPPAGVEAGDFRSETLEARPRAGGE